MQKVTLQPGDYVATADIKDEAEYHAIARAFMDAGCVKSTVKSKIGTFPCLGWDARDNTVYSHDEIFFNGRQLTPAQILGEPQWVPEVGKRCEYTFGEDGPWFKCEMISHNRMVIRCPHLENDSDQGLQVINPSRAIKFRPILAEEDRAVEKMIAEHPVGFTSDEVEAVRSLWRVLHRAGYRKQPQPAEEVDLNDPANWRVGDFLECIKGTVATLKVGKSLTVGKRYTICGFDEDGDPVVIYDEGDSGGEFARYFRFYYRP